MKPHFRSWDDSRRSKFASVGTAQAKKADGAEAATVVSIGHQALINFASMPRGNNARNILPC
jgi:hypothetical protein